VLGHLAILCSSSGFVSIRKRNIQQRGASRLEDMYRVIQEELPPLTELISDDILSKKCHINLCPILNTYRVTFIFGFFLHFNFNANYKLHHLNALIVTKTN
jgi:hypothetical protein